MSEDQTASPPRSPLEERLSRIRQELAAHQFKGRQAAAEIADQPAAIEQQDAPPAAAETSQPAPIGAGVHPAANLARLARRLQPGAPATPYDDASGPAPGPEGMADIAGRLGLSVSMENRRPLALVAADCPCVLMLKDGTSHLVIDAGDRTALTADGQAGPLRLDRKTLEASASGVIFVARPRASLLAAPPAQSDQPKLGLMALLRESFRARRSHVAALVIAGALSSLISLVIPIFTMAVFDRVIPHMALETLWALAIGVTLLLCADFGIRHARAKLSEGISVASSQGVTARLFSRMLFAPMARLPRHSSQLLQPFQDLSSASGLAAQFLASLLVDLPFFLIVLAYLWLIAGPVAALPAAAALVILALHFFVHRSITRLTGEDSRLQQMQQQMMLDGVMAIETIKTTRAGGQFLSHWEQKSDEAAYSAHRMRLLHGVAAHGTATASQLLTVGVLVLGVYQIQNAGMSIGALSAALLLSGRVVAPIGQLVAMYFRLEQVSLTTRGLRSLIETEPEGAGDSDTPRPAISGDIALRNLSFSYGSEAGQSLSGVSLAIRQGERVAVIGRAGCGKSTLLRLLARLIEPTQGSYLIDGRDARQFDPSDIRRSFALMPQETILVDGTIDSNLRLGLGRPDAERLASILALTGVAELTNRHPKGLSLPVGPGGRSLSGGERQAVALSRALLGAPRLLLLDEPTAAMDNEREARIVAGLARDFPGTGMLIATHRLPLLALVDRIIVMDGGRIVADGPREEILRKIGVKAAA